jgi:hypothetical protein
VNQREREREREREETKEPEDIDEINIEDVRKREEREETTILVHACNGKRIMYKDE